MTLPPFAWLALALALAFVVFVALDALAALGDDVDRMRGDGDDAGRRR